MLVALLVLGPVRQFWLRILLRLKKIVDDLLLMVVVVMVHVDLAVLFALLFRPMLIR